MSHSTREKLSPKAKLAHAEMARVIIGRHVEVLAKGIEREKARAEAEGLKWTPPRRFQGYLEKATLKHCSAVGCGRKATFVSYQVGVPGLTRIGLCHKHMTRTPAVTP